MEAFHMQNLTASARCNLGGGSEAISERINRDICYNLKHEFAAQGAKTIVLEVKCLKLPRNPKVMYPNHDHILSIMDEKVNTVFGWDHLEWPTSCEISIWFPHASFLGATVFEGHLFLP